MLMGGNEVEVKTGADAAIETSDILHSHKQIRLSGITDYGILFSNLDL